MDEWDAVVVGGGVAGLSAALYLVRARRSVLVLDSGMPRNRFAARSHGVLALDGQPGAELIKIARAQFLGYPTAQFLPTAVRTVSSLGGRTRFRAECEDGGSYSGRRLILATGLVDSLPEIPGLVRRWGKSVFHCPYCDGYEAGGGPIGVLATLPLSVPFAKVVSGWGKVTLFANGAVRPSPLEREDLERSGVDIEEGIVASLEGNSDEDLTRVRLRDDRTVDTRALFVATLYRQAAPFAEALGCAMEENPRGRLVKTDEAKMTTVPGVYAAGDMARPTHSIPFASADGVTAAVGAHQALIAEDGAPK